MGLVWLAVVAPLWSGGGSSLHVWKEVSFPTQPLREALPLQICAWQSQNRAARQHFIFPAQLVLSFPSEQMTTSEVLQADPGELSLQEA